MLAALDTYDRSTILSFIAENLDKFSPREASIFNSVNFVPLFTSGRTVEECAELIDCNNEIAETFRSIAKFYAMFPSASLYDSTKSIDENRRIMSGAVNAKVAKAKYTAMKNAGDAMASLNFVVTEGKELKGIPCGNFRIPRIKIAGIGDKSIEIVDEYLSKHFAQIFTTGEKQKIYVTRYTDLNNIFADVMSVLNLFESVHGIGRVKAMDLYEKGFRTLQDLWQYADLNDAQRNGLRYYNDIRERIPRSEMDVIISTLTFLFSWFRVAGQPLIWTTAGSYRRGDATSGDIDILISQTHPNVSIQTIVEKLKPSGLFLEILALGKRKCMAIIAGLGKARRMDIRLFKPNEWAYAMMYNTGSYKFNILCRNKAISLGYRLNEYTMLDSQGNSIPAESEEQICALLGIRYYSPEERTEFLTVL